MFGSSNDSLMPVATARDCGPYVKDTILHISGRDRKMKFTFEVVHRLTIITGLLHIH